LFYYRAGFVFDSS